MATEDLGSMGGGWWVMGRFSVVQNSDHVHALTNFGAQSAVERQTTLTKLPDSLRRKSLSVFVQLARVPLAIRLPSQERKH